MSQFALSVSGLSKRFGGLTAVNNVSLQLATGTLHAVIGPNGAGKSTLINLLSGDILPSSGNIQLNGRDISGLSPQQRSQLGIGRSYQKTNIFGGFSTLENCRLAAQSPLVVVRGAETHALSFSCHHDLSPLCPVTLAEVPLASWPSSV